MFGPSPKALHPMAGQPRVVFLNNLNTNPHIEIGDYTYYDDPEDPNNFFRNVLYHFDFIGDRLIIGRFCAIAQHVRFVMNGANHDTEGLSTYPFFAFGNGWGNSIPPSLASPKPGSRLDTVVGNDVWIGYDATIMPGRTIGDGAIIGAKSVVTQDVEPYSIVAGNPAKCIRKRFSDDTISRLLTLAWWNWPAEQITQQLENIISGNIDALEKVAHGTTDCADRSPLNEE